MAIVYIKGLKVQRVSAKSCFPYKVSNADLAPRLPTGGGSAEPWQEHFAYSVYVMAASHQDFSSFIGRIRLKYSCIRMDHLPVQNESDIVHLYDWVAGLDSRADG